MKFRIFLFLIAALSLSNLTFSQAYKTFKNSTDIFEMMEFKDMYPIDSCLVIKKRNPGWDIPDTAQLRDIYSQWFGPSHRQYYYPEGSQQPKVKHDMEGFSFLSSTKAYGENFIKVEMRDPPMKFLAEESNVSGPAYYNLVLIRPQK